MEEADKDWIMIRMVGGRVFLLVPAHPGSPGCKTFVVVVVRVICKLLHDLVSYSASNTSCSRNPDH